MKTVTVATEAAKTTMMKQVMKMKHLETVKSESKYLAFEGLAQKSLQPEKNDFYSVSALLSSYDSIS